MSCQAGGIAINWIDEHIAVGSEKDAENVERLRRNNIDLIIDARTLFHRKAMHGRHTPYANKILRAAEMLVALSNMDARVLVHCKHGKDRTPFLGMLYVSKKYDLSYEDAYGLVKRKRPRTNLHWDWVKMLRDADR